MARSMLLFAAATALLLFAAAAPLAAADGGRPPAFALRGRSMHIALTNPVDNSSVEVRFGRIYEVDAALAPVPGHALPALASLAPTVSNGERERNARRFF